MFNPTALDKAIAVVESSMPDTPAGRIMRAAYRPFMLQLSKELESRRIEDVIFELFQSVSKLCSNLMVTVVRSLNDPNKPGSDHLLLITLGEMLALEITVALHDSHTGKAVFLASHDGTIQ